MSQRALVIAKDLVNELKRLALLASKDDSAFEKARQQYEQAGQTLVSSSSSFAVALYDFALRYAGQPDLVEAKLHELGIQFKRSSTVYVKIARLAFDDTRDEKGEVSRTRVSRYAGIIEAAHAQGLTSVQFKKAVERGVTQAMRKFNTPSQKPAFDAVELGRELVSALAGKQTFAIEHFPLPEDAAEGDDVELLARVEDGKLVVYGMLPSNLSNVRGVLSKLGTQDVIEGLRSVQMLPELLRAIKLVTGTKDVSCLARLSVQGNQVHFAVLGPAASVVLVAPIEMNVFERDSIVLKVGDWRRIVETLNPLRKQIISVSSSASEIAVQFDEKHVPEVDKWFEANGKAKRIGVSTGSTLKIAVEELDFENGSLADLVWKDAVAHKREEIAPLLDFKLARKLVSFPQEAGTLKPSVADKALKDNINLGRKAFSAVQGALSKMLRLSDVITVDTAEGHVRFSCSYDKDYQLSFVVRAE